MCSGNGTAVIDAYFAHRAQSLSVASSVGSFFGALLLFGIARLGGIPVPFLTPAGTVLWVVFMFMQLLQYVTISLAIGIDVMIYLSVRHSKHVETCLIPTGLMDGLYVLDIFHVLSFLSDPEITHKVLSLFLYAYVLSTGIKVALCSMAIHNRVEKQTADDKKKALYQARRKTFKTDLKARPAHAEQGGTASSLGESDPLPKGGGVPVAEGLPNSNTSPGDNGSSPPAAPKKPKKRVGFAAAPTSTVSKEPSETKYQEPIDDSKLKDDHPRKFKNHLPNFRQPYPLSAVHFALAYIMLVGSLSAFVFSLAIIPGLFFVPSVLGAGAVIIVSYRLIPLLEERMPSLRDVSGWFSDISNHQPKLRMVLQLPSFFSEEWRRGQPELKVLWGHSDDSEEYADAGFLSLALGLELFLMVIVLAPIFSWGIAISVPVSYVRMRMTLGSAPIVCPA